MRVRGALSVVATACLVAAGTSAAAIVPREGWGTGATAKASPAWASKEIAAVVAAGAMGPDVARFRPDDPITRLELWEALTALGKSRPYPTDPERLVTMRELNAQLVAAAGGLSASRAIRLAAAQAGLEPTAMLGTETVARLLGFRINHPESNEALERLPTEPASRAEAAYSLARLLALTPQRIAEVVAAGQSFTLPTLDPWQQRVLSRALRLVGFPYVWAGTSEKPQKLWSATAPGNLVAAPGGFDCSGFVWRVFKTQPFAEAPSLAAVLKGRTTFQMSGEVLPALRIPFAALKPGDLVFFGTRGPKSRPSEVGHAGIYVGNGWMAHSSSNGVTLQPLTGWYERTFAWGRRPLAEAGLLVA